MLNRRYIRRLVLRHSSSDESGGTVWRSQAVETCSNHGLPATLADRATHQMTCVNALGLIAIALLVVAVATATAQKTDIPSAQPIEPPSRALGTCLRLIQSERYGEARKLADKLVRDFPKSSRACLMLALADHKNHRYEAAKPNFEKAMELDPHDRAVWSFYGWCLYNLGRADEARGMFEKFLKAQPDYADAHFAIGLLDFEADQIADATTRFQTAIRLSAAAKSRSEEAKARARLADVFVRQEKLEQAKQELEKAVKLNPNLYGAFFKLSRVRLRLGDKEGAEQARRMYDLVRERIRPTKGHAE